MNEEKANTGPDRADSYDAEAGATGWFGPHIVFGLAYDYIKDGERLLDIGIGTGLTAVLFAKAGLSVAGIDLSPDMIAAASEKLPDADLKLHDLGKIPYPFPDGSMDHAVCTGVMHFFDDLGAVFSEAGRIVRKGGVFGFIVANGTPDREKHIVIDHETSSNRETVVLYRHPRDRITFWLKTAGFALTRDLLFTVFMDRERKLGFKAAAYLAEKKSD